MVRFRANFNFVASNPATILILAGVLFLFVGIPMTSINPEVTKGFISTGIVFILLGIVLHVAWLAKRR